MSEALSNAESTRLEHDFTRSRETANDAKGVSSTALAGEVAAHRGTRCADGGGYCVLVFAWTGICQFAPRVGPGSAAHHFVLHSAGDTDQTMSP